MSISKIMSTKLISLDMDDTLSDAKAVFDNYSLHHILITENKKLVGVITEGDVYKNLSPTIGTSKETAQDSFLMQKKIHLIMGKDLITATAETTLNDAVLIFHDKKISCLPVIDENNMPIGIITWRDILRVIALQYRRKSKQNQAD